MPTASGQTVCLSMIVKNESAVIERCLRSVLPFVDRYAILDTGSTDNTVDIAAKVLAPTKEGRIVCEPAHHRTWLEKLRHRNYFNFAAARNRALDLARTQGCDYVLLIDADEAIEMVAPDGTPPGLPHLECSRYVATFRMVEDGRKWHRSLLIRSDEPWEYRYAIHEALFSPTELNCGIVAGIEVPSHSDGARNQDKPAKFLSDAHALRDAIRKDPAEPRYRFYLGQSLAGAGRFRQALDSYAVRVSMMRGWDEEWWYALYQHAPLMGYLGYPWREVRDAYLHAWDARPHRAEPLWAAAVMSRDNGEPVFAELLLRQAADLPIPPDSFLVDPAIYQWRIKDDLAACLAQNGRPAECVEILRELADSPHVPDEERERIRENLAEAVTK